MELGLEEKVAFIAASSKGLGKSVALELAKEGAHVIISGRNKEALDKAKEEIEAAGPGQVLAIQGDLSKAADRKNMLQTALGQFKNIEILVCNTGGPPAGKFESLSQNDWDEAYELLLGSTVELIRGVLPGMKARGWGRIMSISSIAVKQPVANLILSNSVRASVAGLLKTLASELGPYGITVNNVMPGYTETERLKQLIKSNPAFGAAVDEIPLGRFGKPEEFAAAVVFLASNRASYISGVSLAVDGGWIKNIL